MITTKQINISLDKGGKKLERVSTKDVDASIKVMPLKKPAKAVGVSTTSIADVADIATKRERDEIMAQRKAFKKEDVVKSWNKMNAEERKEYQRAKKEKK